MSTSDTRARHSSAKANPTITGERSGPLESTVPLNIDDPDAGCCDPSQDDGSDKGEQQVLTDSRDDAQQHAEGTHSVAADLLKIAQHYRQLPLLDTRTDDDILGYGDDGLPH